MLFLQGQGKTVDDAAEDLKKLRDTVMSLSLIDESEEDVVDGFSNERPVYHELPIDAMQDCFEIVPPRDPSESKSSRSFSTKVLSIYFFPTFASTSFDTT